MNKEVVENTIKYIKDICDAMYENSTDLAPINIEEFSEEIKGYLFDLEQEIYKETK